MIAPPRHYRLFDLTLASDPDLPELSVAPATATPDVTIRFVDDLPPAPPGVHDRPGGLLLAVEGVARFAISGGTDIAIHPDSDVPARNLRLFLLGSAMGLLALQRGLLPLHANAVTIDGHAVGFMGPPGAGKSTLAAWCADRGLAILADDACAVRFDPDGRALALPGVPRLRLWRDAMTAFARDPADHFASFIGADAPDKFDITLASAAVARTPLPLAALYLLNDTAIPGISPLTGADAFAAISANTYRGGFVAKAGQGEAHWNSAVAIARAVPVFAVGRRRGWDHYNVEATRLTDHARAIIARNSPVPSA